MPDQFKIPGQVVFQLFTEPEHGGVINKVHNKKTGMKQFEISV